MIRGIAFFLLFYPVSLVIPAYSQEGPYFAQPKEVILIPGLLGSRLSGDGKVIWGDLLRNDPDFFFRDGNLARAEPLPEMEVGGHSIRGVAYGEFFRMQLDDLSLGQPIFPFSYDWRASNRLSAHKFQEFICDANSRSELPKIIVAHSMGGLVLKHWLINYHGTSCGDSSEEIKIDSIIFVATPHLGAPESFLTFIDEVSLIDFPFVDGVVSRSLNRYGVTFDSIYELFPFSNSYQWQDGKRVPCFDAPTGFGSGLSKHRVRIKQENRGQRLPIDIFSADVLGRLGAYKKLEELQISDPQAYLADKLDRAREVTCALSSFVMPDELEDKAYYISGRLLHPDGRAVASTVSDLVISRERPTGEHVVINGVDDYSSREWFVEVIREVGDNTVPTDIADGDLLGRGRRFNDDHIGLLSAYELGEMIDAVKLAGTVSDDLPYYRIRETYENVSPAGEIRNALIYSMEENQFGGPVGFGGYLEPYDLGDPGMIFSEGSLDLATVNALAAQKSWTSGGAGIFSSQAFSLAVDGQIDSAEELLRFVDGSENSEDWRFVGYVEDVPIEERVRALDFAGALLLREGRFNEAFGVRKTAIELGSTSIEGTNGDLLEAVLEVRVNLGMLAFREGDLAAAYETLVPVVEQLGSRYSDALLVIDALLDAEEKRSVQSNEVFVDFSSDD